MVTVMLHRTPIRTATLAIRITIPTATATVTDIPIIRTSASTAVIGVDMADMVTATVEVMGTVIAAVTVPMERAATPAMEHVDMRAARAVMLAATRVAFVRRADLAADTPVDSGGMLAASVAAATVAAVDAKTRLYFCCRQAWEAELTFGLPGFLVCRPETEQRTSVFSGVVRLCTFAHLWRTEVLRLSATCYA